MTPQPSGSVRNSCAVSPLMHGFWDSQASVSGKVSGWRHQGVLTCRWRICQEYELWCNKNHLRGLWCFWNRVPESRGPGPRKESGAVGVCAAQSTGPRAWEEGGCCGCEATALPPPPTAVSGGWLRGCVRLRRTGFTSVHAEKGTEKVTGSLKM